MATLTKADKANLAKIDARIATRKSRMAQCHKDANGALAQYLGQANGEAVYRITFGAGGTAHVAIQANGETKHSLSKLGLREACAAIQIEAERIFKARG